MRAWSDGAANSRLGARRVPRGASHLAPRATAGTLDRAMTAGIKVVAEIEGSGRRAEKGDMIAFECAASLNKGDVIHTRRAETVVLGSRRFIAGVEYALVGMREGARWRSAVRQPHPDRRAQKQRVRLMRNVGETRRVEVE